MQEIKTAEKLIELSERTVRRLFDAQGKFYPMVHFVRANGTHDIFHFPSVLQDNKDNWAGFARAVLKAEHAVICVFINEAWMLELAGGSPEQVDEYVAKGLEQVPGRREIIMFGAEDSNGQVQADMPIIRPGNGRKPYLGDLTVRTREGVMEGRFVGMLPTARNANA